jgi:predicted nuclease of predicted toxin-antitoxin system
MKMKLDENLGRRSIDLLAAAGHDVATVEGQGLSSAPDVDVIAACHAERRALVTLDLDFSNPLRFVPSEYSGIAVLRLPRKPSHQDLIDTVRTLIEAMRTEKLEGCLWSVEARRVRIYQQPFPD